MSDAKTPFKVMTVLLVLLGALRFAHWSAPLTDDEAFMLRNYAREPVKTIATHYEAPNNHQLLAILLHGIDRASPKRLIESLRHHGVMRLPSILASIGSLLLLFLIGSAAVSPGVGFLAAVGLGVSYWHLLYSHLLRGYSLGTFFGLLCVWSLVEGLLRRRRRALWVLPPALAAFNYAVASDLYFTAALLVWAIPLILRVKKEDRPTAAVAGWAVAGGVLLTVALFYPVWDAMRQASGAMQLSFGASLAATGDRLKSALEILGRGWPLRAIVLVFAAAGVRRLWGGRREERQIARLALSMVLVPLVLFTLHRTVPFTRTFLIALPFWMLTFAAGLLWAVETAAKKLELSEEKRVWAPACAAAVILLLSAGQVHAFVHWNQGMELRTAMQKLLRLLRSQDEYVVIYTPRTPDNDAGRLNWEYYSHAAGFQPQVSMTLDRDHGYLLRLHYYVVAFDSATARKALEESRLDSFLLGRMKLVAESGRLGIYAAHRDQVVFDAYKKHFSKKVKGGAFTVEALSAIGYAHIRRRRFAQAVRVLEWAKRFAPDDPRVRYHLAKAHYLALDDARAAPELKWCVDNDKSNFHAPFYLADVLAGLGQKEAALGLYAQYTTGSAPAGAWWLRNWAVQGYQSLEADVGWTRPTPGDAKSWLMAAHAFDARGSYERAVTSLAEAIRLEPTALKWVGLFKGLNALELNSSALEVAEKLARADQGPEGLLFKADALMGKRRYEEAREAVRAALEKDSKYERALKLEAELKRL